MTNPIFLLILNCRRNDIANARQPMTSGTELSTADCSIANDNDEEENKCIPKSISLNSLMNTIHKTVQTTAMREIWNDLTVPRVKFEWSTFAIYLYYYVKAYT